MRQYTVYHLDGSGHVTTTERLDAPGDEAAIDAAYADIAPGECELWQGRRLVTRLANGAPIASQPTPTRSNMSAATP